MDETLAEPGEEMEVRLFLISVSSFFAYMLGYLVTWIKGDAVWNFRR